MSEFNFKAGQRIYRKDCSKLFWIEVLCVGTTHFFGRDWKGDEYLNPLSFDWQLYQEPAPVKKTKLVSPPIVKIEDNVFNVRGLKLAQALHETVPQGDLLVQWPARVVLKNVRARADEPGEEGRGNHYPNLEADLFFEIEERES